MFFKKKNPFTWESLVDEMSKTTWEQWWYTAATDSESLSSVHRFPWNQGRQESFASLAYIYQCMVGWATNAPPAPRTMTHQQKEKVWYKTSGVRSENMTQEILRFQMVLQGENKMGVKVGGYITTVIELKCIVYLISLTALIGWFKPSKHLGKPDVLPSRACWSNFSSLQKIGLPGIPRRWVWKKNVCISKNCPITVMQAGRRLLEATGNQPFLVCYNVGAVSWSRL